MRIAVDMQLDENIPAFAALVLDELHADTFPRMW